MRRGSGQERWTVVMVVEEEVVQGGWDAAPARAMMAALTERERW